MSCCCLEMGGNHREMHTMMHTTTKTLLRFIEGGGMGKLSRNRTNHLLASLFADTFFAWFKLCNDEKRGVWKMDFDHSLRSKDK